MTYTTKVIQIGYANTGHYFIWIYETIPVRIAMWGGVI